MERTASAAPGIGPVSGWIGHSIETPGGDRLGTIRDFLIDVETARVGYALMSCDGFLSAGEKLFPVPPRSLRTDGTRVVLAVDVRLLKNAPAFEGDSIPDGNDRGWGARVYAYYGFTPYWE